MQIGGMIGLRPVDTNANAQQQITQIPFADFSPGETVSAKVIGTDGKSVVLQAPNGSEVTTELPQGVIVGLGDMVDLTMVSKNPNMVHMKLNAVNGQSVSLESTDMQVYLMEMGVPPSEINESAAQLLTNSNVEPNRQNIANLIDVASILPNTPTSVAVFMAANKIPITQENADILSQWAFDSASMDQDIASLEDTVAQMTVKADPEQPFTQRFTSAAKENPVLQQSGILNADGDGFANLANALENADPDNAKTLIRQFVEQTEIPEQQRPAVESALTEVLQTEHPTANVSEQIAPSAGNDGAQTLPQPAAEGENAHQQPQVNVIPAETAPVAVEKNISPTQPQENNAPKVETAKNQATDDNANRAVDREQNVARNEENTEKVQTQTKAQAGEEGKPNTVERAAGQPHAQLEKATADSVLSNLGKMVVKIKNGGAQANGKVLEESVKTQEQSINSAKNTLAAALGEHSLPAAKADNIASQVKLGNQMDQFFYCQIPFETMEQQGNADLYVFERKNAKQEAGERTHVTVLIGLDTQNMGRVETILRSEEEKLFIEFRVESDRVQKYFNDGRVSFAEEMKESGFDVESIKVVHLNEKTTPINALQVLEPQKEVRIQGLDIQV